MLQLRDKIATSPQNTIIEGNDATKTQEMVMVYDKSQKQLIVEEGVRVQHFDAEG